MNPVIPTPRVELGGVVGQVDSTQVPHLAAPGTFSLLPRPEEVSNIECGRRRSSVRRGCQLPLRSTIRTVSHSGVVAVASSVQP